MGHHSVYSATRKSDRLTVHRTLSAMIGSAARRYDRVGAVRTPKS